MLERNARGAMAGYLRSAAIILSILGLMLVVIEGMASYTLLLYDIAVSFPIAERKHTKYDPELGWINEPGIYIPDMYGPGVYLKVNSQGFRSNRDFAIEVPDGKLRIICSGDSFTLGYGVDNDHTWCDRLTSLDSRLESVNMGQGGYGIDQTYLWYKRDGTKFGHQIQILAFITEDFRRMSGDTFMGYGKPVIKEQNNALWVTNVPVPLRAYNFPWFTTHVENLNRMRIFQLSHMALRKFGLMQHRTSQSTYMAINDQTRKVLRKIFDNLKHLNEKQSSQLVLVHFPTLKELTVAAESPREWFEFIEAESRSQDIAFINVFDDFRSLSHEEVVEMFRVDGHFTEKGNDFVARALLDKLHNDRKFSRVFSSIAAS